MAIGDRIKALRTEKGYTQIELAEKVNVSKQTWYKYENNIITNIPNEKVEAIADALNVTPAYLMGWSESRLPVYGRVAAGIPMEMIEDVQYPEDEYARDRNEYFVLVVHGDSMMPDFHDGDTVIVHKQAAAESGDIVVVAINGDEATCKKLRIKEDGIDLIPLNPAYSPFEFTAEQVARMPVRIIGKVVEVRRHI